MIFSPSYTNALDHTLANENPCRCVAFRLDDVQDYFLINAQIQVINTFEKKNTSLTIGVIGNAFGNDPSIISFIRERITTSNTSAIEVANHGWDHEDFTTFAKEQQSSLIQKSNEKIMQVLNVRPKVFIPPYNLVNNNTIAALLENDLRYLSANSTLYPPSVLTNLRNDTLSSTEGILHFPSEALTGDLNSDDTEWIGYTHETTFAAVNASISKLGYAVVTMHPMEFSLRNGTTYQNEIDQKQLYELELLMDDIKAAGFIVVTISQIEDHSAVIPEFSGYHVSAILALSITTIWLLTMLKQKIFWFSEK
jgi:peptidoglycan/xylan/chitin deacetylase (PgdA/CDA1 family)